MRRFHHGFVSGSGFDGECADGSCPEPHYEVFEPGELAATHVERVTIHTHTPAVTSRLHTHGGTVMPHAHVENGMILVDGNILRPS